jgi:2-keto-4-pentenoate hydratase/2-oxohepta-3-ene-1,7-dioic acid hydratase in catechol pathway
MNRLRRTAAPVALADVELFSPVSTPTKIMAAPANYRRHVEEDTRDPGVDQGIHRAQMLNLDKPTYTYGLFLKANSSLVGPAEGIHLSWPDPDRRVDHEVEVAVVIGRQGRHIDPANALAHVAGLALGLDVTVRGTEDRSFRKSGETFAVLGPWLTTLDEIADPDDLTFWLSVNDQERQRSSTRQMTVGISDLIAFASRHYTLYPGDILMTGTPEGVGPLAAGDMLTVGGEGLGDMRIRVR